MDKGQAPVVSRQWAEILAQQKQITDSIKFQLDNVDVLKRVKAFLQGKVVGPDGNEIDMGKRLMNDEGINQLLFIVNSATNKNIILSDFEYPTVERFMVSIHEDISDYLFLRYHLIEMDPSQISSITTQVCLNVLSSLQRAVGGKERESLNKVREVIEKIGSDSSNKSRGISL